MERFNNTEFCEASRGNANIRHPKTRVSFHSIQLTQTSSWVATPEFGHI